MKKEIILIGGGGHCRSCIDVIEKENKFKIMGIVDVKENLLKKVLGYEIIATDQDLKKLITKYRFFLITIAQLKCMNKRIDIFKYLKKLGAKFPVVISPLAYVSKYASIGEGTIVMHNALINTGSTIGKNCIVNTGALVEHDTKIGGHCHISTCSVINGGCSIGENVFMGTNGAISNGVDIAQNCVIGAGSVVVKSINKPGTYVGNPAKRIK